MPTTYSRSMAKHRKYVHDVAYWLGHVRGQMSKCVPKLSSRGNQGFKDNVNANRKQSGGLKHIPHFKRWKDYAHFRM